MEKYLGVAHPSLTFVALGAVGRDAMKLARWLQRMLLQSLFTMGFEQENDPVSGVAEVMTRPAKFFAVGFPG
jgi:hypothetical protein